MHELAVAQEILKIATQHARAARAARVTRLRLTIGQLTSFVDDSIQFYWDVISQHTICEGSRLHFERIPARLMCLECGSTYDWPNPLTACPHCSSRRVQITAGQEFRLDSIDIEEEEFLRG